MSCSEFFRLIGCGALGMFTPLSVVYVTTGSLYRLISDRPVTIMACVIIIVSTAFYEWLSRPGDCNV